MIKKCVLLCFLALFCALPVLGKTQAEKLKLSPRAEMPIGGKGLTYNNFKNKYPRYYPSYFPTYGSPVKMKVTGGDKRGMRLKFCDQRSLEYNMLDASNYVTNNKSKVYSIIPEGKCFTVVVDYY
jgi:hypothetical protein